MSCKQLRGDMNYAVLFVLMVGGSFIKSIISASVAKETTEATRARGYSIFYMMVNVGAFTGKTIIDPLRNVIGEQAYIYINYFSGAMTIIALLAVILLYKSTHTRLVKEKVSVRLGKDLCASSPTGVY